MQTENEIVLPDGRKLAYAEFGLPDGDPVLFLLRLMLGTMGGIARGERRRNWPN